MGNRSPPPPSNAAGTVETKPPEPNVAHFAFFESVLTCGDFEKYLDDSLKHKAGDLKSYLGNFVSVTVPTEKFYTLHRDIAAAGLVYPLNKQRVAELGGLYRVFEYDLAGVGNYYQFVAAVKRGRKFAGGQLFFRRRIFCLPARFCRRVPA